MPARQPHTAPRNARETIGRNTSTCAIKNEKSENDDFRNISSLPYILVVDLIL